ncbi:MAG: dual specificity protein phosphatase family protein [Desulfovibrionaceae bacterium]|jgi:protein-tyrosine phosphatase|nr:dual specificity protein phosphatase family protein [Desulfovibrionaceae bacterium]
MEFGASARKPLVWVTDNLAVGAAPLSQAHMDLLRAEGIDAVLNLCAEFCDLHDIERDQGFEVYHMPVWDEEAPDLKEMEAALAWLDECLYLGKRVLIHCRHGIGRTGTVLNAYFLRRGLGHRGAARALKRLRSKPANFTQWRTVRRYGKANVRLTVREPSLETRRLVDLAPFLRDYDRLAAWAEDLAGMEAAAGGRCGRGHDRCARVPIQLSLAEAVHLRTWVDQHLTSAEREGVIDRAVETARKERRAAGRVREERLASGRLDAGGGEESCLYDAGGVCPLHRDGGCMVFEGRPLQCRTWDLPEEVKADLWENVLAAGLADVSQAVFLAFASRPAPGDLPHFALCDVVSGRYVQSFFHLLMALESDD